MMNNHLKVKEVINQFDFSGELFTIEPFGSGHINDTYLVKFKIKHININAITDITKINITLSYFILKLSITLLNISISSP